MSIVLKRFSIQALHGKYDVDIPIDDNRLILVGVNGLGKTTVVNTLYYLLTSQWGRLLETDFKSVSLVVNESKIRLERQDIQLKLSVLERHEKTIFRLASRSPYPTRVVQRILAHPSLHSISEASGSVREKVARDLSRELDVPTQYILRVVTELTGMDDLFESKRKDSPAMLEFQSVLKQVGNHQVIYLPTYRRIEQDLKSVFPNLDEDDLRKLTARSDFATSTKVRGHVELVHFGMQDVEKKIEGELEAIRERTRSQLTNLTATYLQDIIRNRADDVQTEFFKDIGDETVDAVLERVEENTLSYDDKQEVRNAIRRIRQDGSVFEVRDKYLAYFFSRLLEIFFNLRSSERRIRSLFDTCNQYFDRKYLAYDDASFSASIVDIDGSPLSWKMLSSGEKQVASLFTHLFLSKEGVEQTVIIDEPELSLSVPWQKRLLPDISDSDHCNLLIAVTHSPFIYSNKLDGHAIDLSRCIRPTWG
jgi:predicted ATP-dependent endonuclease of OLD family